MLERPVRSGLDRCTSLVAGVSTLPCLFFWACIWKNPTAVADARLLFSCRPTADGRSLFRWSRDLPERSYCRLGGGHT